MSATSERLLAAVRPEHTAVLTMELQKGVVGAQASLPVLADEVARTGSLVAAGRVCAAARTVGARVVHCMAVMRPDGAGFVENCRVLAITGKVKRSTGHYPTELGTVGVELMKELDVQPSDLQIHRLHGMSPFTSTSLDQLLRNMGVRTVVATGVSVNLGIFGMAMSALDLGYQVVVVRDAVAGVPAEYAAQVIEHSLSMIATVVSTDELLGAWGV
jgi:nicotinamidase-related amidase